MTVDYLPENWLKKWQDVGFVEPTQIQKKVYAPLIDGKNVLGVSPTGSGKTIAYLIPLLQTLQPKAGNQLLVLVSSQELAMQVAEVARDWGKVAGLSTQTIIGGANVKRQIEKLKSKPEILVGTPGRVLELIKAKKIKAHLLRTVILDEVDQLLKKGTVELTEPIIKSLSKETQICCFSATGNQIMPELTQMLSSEVMLIDVTKEDDSKGEVLHLYLNYPKRKVVDALRRLAHLEAFQGLVFFNQLADMGSAEEKLLFHQIPTASLASDQNKLFRRQALDQFKNGELKELLTTDVAARGLDIEGLTYVINAEVPLTVESYLHRTGRVGRMGKSGIVITLVQDNTLQQLKKIAKQGEIFVEEIYLHGGKLHTSNPDLEKNDWKTKSVRQKKEKPGNQSHTKKKNKRKRQAPPKKSTKRRP